MHRALSIYADALASTAAALDNKLCSRKDMRAAAIGMC